MSVGLSLVTKGMIGYPPDDGSGPFVIQVVPLLSCDAPVLSSALELRPSVKDVSAPPPAAEAVPFMISAQELKPVMRDADAPPVPDPDPRPIQTSAAELRPVIKKAEEY